MQKCSQNTMQCLKSSLSSSLQCSMRFLQILKLHSMLQKLYGKHIPPLFIGLTISRQRLEAAYSLSQLGLRSISLGTELTTFVEFMTSPADKILNRWFESDILKATLATDAIIGAKVEEICSTIASTDDRRSHRPLPGQHTCSFIT